MSNNTKLPLTFNDVTLDQVEVAQSRLDTMLSRMRHGNTSIMEDRKQLMRVIKLKKHQHFQRRVHPEQSIARTSLGDAFPINSANIWFKE